MNSKTRELIVAIIIMFVMFVTSFCDFNGVYFILCIPIMSALVAYKNSYLLYGGLGMFIAACLIRFPTLPIILTATFALSCLISAFLNKFKLSPRVHLSILGIFFGFALSWTIHFSPLHGPIVNLLFAPVLTYFLCYYVCNINFEFKSREKFSLTRKELMIIAFLFNSILFHLDLSLWGFKITFVILLIISYMLLKIDSLVGMVACLFCIIFNLTSGEYLMMALYLLTLIFALKPLNINRYCGGIVYLLVSSATLLYFNDIVLIREIIFATITILFIPEKIFLHLGKYVIEPQDYELKLYQESYYKCLNRNKKIQRVMNALENQIQKNPKMKKNTKDIILQDMQFLSDKLKEEDNIHLKQNILNDLQFNHANVLGLKLYSDYLDNYKIIIEVKNSEIGIEKIIDILQNHLVVKLKKSHSYYNRIICSQKYIIVNNQKLEFNYYIKQRSKESGSCGDNYLCFNVKNKKYTLVSDGMGHGKKASKESGEALFLLKNFIELGMGPNDSIILCNAVLVDKDEETFNTLDLLEYNVFDNELYLYKNGSGATYLKTDEGVEKIVSENLPLGIIEKIKVEKVKLNINSKYIVLTSDGIKNDLTDVIKNSKCKNAKALAQEILSYEGDKVEDDQTIVVINVIKKD